MTFLDLTLPTPAENVACDEALLDACEAGGGGELLRVWESPQYFVAVGYANHVERETHRAVCESRGIPILRRCTGGGTVVQGPGCLNYALVMDMAGASSLKSISSANRFIMERNRAALESLLNRPVELRGHTDLTINGLKFSGNAQRRRKRFLLFHGTFLLDLDLSIVGELLPSPSREPDYRRNRPHADFLMNLQASAASVKEALRQHWRAVETFRSVPYETIALLARDKYATDGWNLKF